MQLMGWTLVHSVWEGGVIALVLAVAFWATRSSAASLRYAIGMIGLVLMVVLPVATAARMDRQSPVVQNAATAPVTPTEILSLSDPGPTPNSEASPALASVEPAVTSPVTVDPRTWILSALEPALPWMVAAWLIGLVVLSVRMIGGVARTRRIVREGTAPASEAVRLLVARISQILGVRRAVRALEGTRLTVPVVVGWIRPVIVLPVSLVSGLTPSQLEMLLAHEIAHIRRYDYLANLLQTVVETLLFFHPAAWWLSDRIREERENCCDDIAVLRLRRRPEELHSCVARARRVSR